MNGWRKADDNSKILNGNSNDSRSVDDRLYARSLRTRFDVHRLRPVQRLQELQILQALREGRRDVRGLPRANMKERFIKLLEEDIARLREEIEAWKLLEKHGARLEDLNGNVIATATERINDLVERDKQLQALIDQANQ